MTAWPPATEIGGNWVMSDRWVGAINDAATAHGVPANLVRAVLQRESGGRFDPDANPTDEYCETRKKPDGSCNLLMGFSGVYETTAATWGCDWGEMRESPAAQIGCIAKGLARLDRDYGDTPLPLPGGGTRPPLPYEAALLVYHGGTRALTAAGYADETGLRSRDYADKALADWAGLDRLSGGDMATYQIPGLAVPVTLSFPLRVALMPTTQTNQRPGRPFNGGAWDHYTQHETANTRAGANVRMHENWLRSGADGQQLGFHLCVDDREAAVFVPLDEVAWHAGDGAGPGNLDSVACELCVNADADKARARANAAELAGQVLRARGLPIDRLVQHNRWSGKDCPKQLRAEAGAWSRFVADAARHLGAPSDPPSNPAFPPGWTEAMLGGLWGDEYGTTYAFNPAGAVSRVWLKERLMSPLVYHVKEPSGWERFCFTNGIVGRNNASESFRVVDA